MSWLILLLPLLLLVDELNAKCQICSDICYKEEDDKLYRVYKVGDEYKLADEERTEIQPYDCEECFEGEEIAVRGDFAVIDEIDEIPDEGAVIDAGSCDKGSEQDSSVSAEEEPEFEPEPEASRAASREEHEPKAWEEPAPEKDLGDDTLNSILAGLVEESDGGAAQTVLKEQVVAEQNSNEDVDEDDNPKHDRSYATLIKIIKKLNDDNAVFKKDTLPSLEMTLDEELAKLRKDKKPELPKTPKEIIDYIIGTDKKKDANKKDYPDHGKSKLFPALFPKKVKEWGEAELKQWSGHIQNDRIAIMKGALKGFLIPEIIAVLMQAVYLHTERSDEFKDPFYPRDAQILVVMIYLYRKKALFGQVGTGEGKSIDIIMISAAYALMGKKVHVVTSSTYLAKRDSDAAQDFFRSVGLKVSQNSDQPKNRNGFARLCYTGIHVVYGTGFSFARDILHHTFSGNNTMGEHFNLIGTSRLIALVDEVDDLAIDNKHIFTRLLSRFPGADLLEPLMTAMYDKSKKKHDPRKRQRGGGATTESASKAVIDFLTTFAEEKIKTYKDLILEEKKLKENKMTPEEVDSTKILLPLQFDLDPTHFARKEARNWAEAFFKAERMHKKVHYFINTTTSAINIVDNARTGQVYDNRQYDHGLQQGIAYKEQNVKLTPISLITSFLNTLLFLQMYKENLLGMTGTFGSLYSKQFMEKNYNVNLVRVPLFKKSGFVETKAVFTKNHEEWLKEITTQTLKMTGDYEIKKRGKNPKPRAVLIICDSMQDVDLIADEFRILLKAEQDKIYKKNYDKAVNRAGFREKLRGELNNPPKYPPPSRRIRTIYNTDQMRKESHSKAKPGDIIVATNAAARGAEIGSSDDLVGNGNIDVNLTYIPDSRRIMKQVYGRASRGGKPGTGHMTINLAKYPQYSSPDLKLTVEKVKADMDLKEKGELNAFKGFEYTYRIVFMSEIFEKFKKTFNYIRWGSEVHVPGHVPPAKHHSETDNNRSYWNQAAEHWGLKYREYEAQLETAKNDTKDKDALTKAKAAIIKDSDEFMEALKKKFDKVRDQTADDLTLFDNPAYLTNLGVIRFFKQPVKDAESAEKAFDKMIAKDKPFALAAQINRLYVEASKKVPGRSNILDDVTGATTNIHRLLDELNITRDILKNARGGLRKQLKNKEMIYNKLLTMLGDCRDVVETCKHPPKGYKSCKYVKLDDLTPLNEEFSVEEEAAMLDELKAFDKDGIFKYLYLSAHLVDNKGETHIYPFQEAPKKKKKRKVPTFMGIPLGSSPKRHKRAAAVAIKNIGQQAISLPGGRDKIGSI